MEKNALTEVAFSDLDLDETLLRGVEDAGFKTCMPIQAQTLPKALEGVDVAGQAHTGTGKSAAFLLATMNRLLRVEPLPKRKDGWPRAIILAPTRELAIQIHADAKVLGRHSGLRLGVVYGGTGYDSQRDMLRDGLDILIGTPGRLIDYFKQGVFGLGGVQVMVLDEADRMFDLGFIKDIRYLLHRLPAAGQRQNMLFSATLSHKVSELAYEHMNDPLVINTAGDEVTVKGVRQILYHVSKEEKIPLLLGLLQAMKVERTIIFVNTKRGAERVTDYLGANGFESGMLSGDVPQSKRSHLFAKFRDGNLPILVATDVAARGLHIPAVSHVFNFDLPQEAEDYVHRIGRTARAGAEGDAVSFGCDQYVYSLGEIQDYIGEKIPVAMVDDDMLVKPKHPKRRPPRPRAGGRGGPCGGRPGGGRPPRRR